MGGWKIGKLRTSFLTNRLFSLVLFSSIDDTTQHLRVLVSEIALTKYYKLSGLSNRNLLSHGPGD